MKSKKSIYILIPVVLLIWGLVIYKFVSFSNPDTIPVTDNPNLKIEPLAIKKPDSSVINVNYRDPFLGKMYTPANAATRPKSLRKTAKAEPIAWPNILYKGIVSDLKDKNKVFMVIINGQTYLMREKDIEQGITLKSGNTEYISVNYKGDVTQIQIQE